MAHADYHCCAVCDKKISFGGFGATTKEQICSECVANLAEKGVIVHNGLRRKNQRRLRLSFEM